MWGPESCPVRVAHQVSQLKRTLNAMSICAVVQRNTREVRLSLTASPRRRSLRKGLPDMLGLLSGGGCREVLRLCWLAAPDHPLGTGHGG